MVTTKWEYINCSKYYSHFQDHPDQYLINLRRPNMLFVYMARWKRILCDKKVIIVRVRISHGRQISFTCQMTSVHDLTGVRNGKLFISLGLIYESTVCIVYSKAELLITIQHLFLHTCHIYMIYLLSDFWYSAVNFMTMFKIHLCNYIIIATTRHYFQRMFWVDLDYSSTPLPTTNTLRRTNYLAAIQIEYI